MKGIIPALNSPARQSPNLKLHRLLHGGDYNPDQWLDSSAVLEEDLRLMKLAGVNAVSLGIFAWSALEPEEGRFEFGWLDRIFESLHRNEIAVILATPGGAKPAWLAQRYPETLRVDALGRRQLWGGRHNHCFTSPAFRAKSQLVNEKLATRYNDHPALILWHVNNEYNGECHCELCRGAFRQWLRVRYHVDLGALNRAWWNTFWSHQITDWNQINPPSSIGETQVHALNLDWKRFVTDQTIDCFRAEIEPLRRITPHVPITTNFMGAFSELDYYRFARELDVISWDGYPSYHDRPDDWLNAVQVSFIHSQRRAMLDKPFLMMESAPSQQNYKPVCKLKRPGAHRAEGLQAIAHGSESVLYFQWRKSRGAVEKFHGAVVDHFATENTRTFREVAEVGAILKKLDDVVGTQPPPPEVAIVYDYQNRWAIDDAKGFNNERKDYLQTCVEHYRPFWSAGVGVDVIGEDGDLGEGGRYKLLIAPMLYMVRRDVAERIERFVRSGGTFVATYLSGLVDESDLCFLNGFPGPLRKLLGVWVEETDSLYQDESLAIDAVAGNEAGLSGSYRARSFCDVLHAEGAQVQTRYAGEFYAGQPAVTVNRVGSGAAWYVGSRNDARFHDDFYSKLIEQLRLSRALPNVVLPQGVMAATRVKGDQRFVFVISFRRDACELDLGHGSYHDRLSGSRVSGRMRFSAYGTLVLEVAR